MKRRILATLVLSLLVLVGCGNQAQQYAKNVDVSEINQEAADLYEKEEYEESLKLYNEAMADNPIDMEARLGVVKNYIALERYDLASINLSAAQMVNPKDREILDLYVEMSKKSENINWAKTAINIAKRYDIEDFLELVPKAPTFSVEGGSFDERITVEVSCAENDAKVYVTEVKNSMWMYDGEYAVPFTLTSGETVLTAYCVVDGMPSDTVEATYICDYGPSIITFADPMFAKLISQTLGKPESEITDIDCEGITNLYTSDLRQAYDDYSDYEKVQIKSLDDLKYLPNLTYISVDSHQSIKNFEPITLCTRLNQLSVYGCELNSLEIVRKMPALRYLYVEDCNITDLSPVLECKNLYGLAIDGNPIKDISQLKSLENLRYINIDDDQVGDWSIFLDWENINDLSIEGIIDIDYSVISQMTWITQLNIYRDWDDYRDYSKTYGKETYIGNLSFVEPLVNLEYLYISGLQDLSEIHKLKNLSNLNYLYLYNRYEKTDNDDQEVRNLQKSLPNCTINY